MFAYVDEFIEDNWDRYQTFLDDNNLFDSDMARSDFTDLRMDDYVTFVAELGETEYTGDEGDYGDLEFE